MKSFLFIFLFLFILNCDTADKTENEIKYFSGEQAITQDRKSIEILDPYDSLENLRIDTTTLIGKRQFILVSFLLDNTPSNSDYDTLFDLNYDGYNDYIIGYYGQAGTGIKNRIKVYFFDKEKERYTLNEQLSDLSNPTFYLDRKQITCFYIGNGGGGGSRLEWIKNKWTITKEFNVSNEEEKTIWQISYPLKSKKEKFVRSFQTIPPSEILETNIMF